jgi:hypothetical protein
MWWLCLLTDRDEMSNLHRGHSLDASYQVLVVAKFVNDQDEMSNIFFLANLAKSNMSFWHHLVSVVRLLFTF